MNWTNVKLIFLRELRDQLRDRRTLFMIIVLPILLYPMIGIGMSYFIQLFSEQSRLVVVIGREHLPAQPPLLAGGGFVADLFEVPTEADQLRVVEEAVNETDAKNKLESGDVQVILIVPPDITEQIERGTGFQWQTMYNSADEKSRIAYLRLREALDNWKQQIIRGRIEANALPRDFANPFVLDPHDIATPQQISGGLIWSKLMPFLLVVMALTGAFYPAVDLCAGEKERGTMETLLISPAGRGEIVIGKFLTICIFSMATAILNLLSMAATGWVVARRLGASLPENAEISVLAPPSAASAGWIVLLLVPMAAFFSALGIALAAFARSTKEGQYYLTPLFLVTMPLVLVTLAPGIELNAFYSVVPVTGVALLLKTLILGQYSLALEFLAPVLLPTILYAALALRWAIDQFNREEVLFREAERLDLWLWARHLLRDKGAFPSAVEAILCYAIMLLLVWFLLLSGLLTSPSSDVEPAAQQAALQRSIIILHVAFVATPALIMAVMLTASARQTLMIRRTAWHFVGLALLLALALHPIVLEASQHIHRGMPGQPKWMEEQVNKMLDVGQPLWWQLLLIGILPAVCEELAFRGFILSGLLRRMSPPTAIIVSGFLFGFFHFNPQQLLTATVLGWVLGIIATRSGSLLPGMVFHFANNALAVLMSNLQSHVESSAQAGDEAGVARFLFDRLYRQPIADTVAYQVPYSVSVLVICGIAATLVLTWLIKQPYRAPAIVGADSVLANESQPRRTGGDGFQLDRFANPSLNPLTQDPRDATA